MLRKVICLFPAPALAMLIGCATAPHHGPVVESADLASAGYLKYWDVELPFQAGEQVRAAHLVDENLYVTSTLGNFYVVEAQQGLLRWTKAITEPEYTVHRPTHLRSAAGPGPLCVVTTSRTYLLDRYDGEEINSFVPEFAPGGSAIGDESRLYFGGADGMVHCLSWKHPFGRVPIDRWELMAQGPVRAMPMFSGPDKLVFASQGGFLASCYTFDKALDWRAHTEDAILADPWVDDSGVYVACTDRSLYKFDVSSGALLWRKRFPQPLTRAPIVHRGMVFQHCEGVGLSVLDAASGDERWVRADGVKFISGRAGEVVLLTERGSAEVVGLDSGDTVRELAGSGVAFAVTNTTDDRVILLGSDGQISCARPDTSPYLRRQQVLAAKDMLRSAPTVTTEVPPPPAAPKSAERDPFRSERDK